MKPERGSVRPLDWDRIMAFGFGKLKLSPDAFWSMSLRELNAALRWYSPDHTASDTMSRDQLAMLMQQHPDTNGAPDEH